MICAVHGHPGRSPYSGVVFCRQCYLEAVHPAIPEGILTAIVRRIETERDRRRAADVRAVQRRLEGKPNA